MTDDDIRHLRELLSEATPGPWEPTRDTDGRSGAYWRFDGGDRGHWAPVLTEYGFETDADARVACAARNALPTLLDEVERLRGLACSQCGGLGQVVSSSIGHPESVDCDRCAATGAAAGPMIVNALEKVERLQGVLWRAEDDLARKAASLMWARLRGRVGDVTLARLCAAMEGAND